MEKIVNKFTFKEEIRSKLKRGGTIALCHGVFNSIHPGHIIYLQQAKQMVDILVVSITAAEFVRKGSGKPYFNDEMRLKVLEAIECVDYVMISEGYTVDDIVESAEPDLFLGIANRQIAYLSQKMVYCQRQFRFTRNGRRNWQVTGILAGGHKFCLA